MLGRPQRPGLGPFGRFLTLAFVLVRGGAQVLALRRDCSRGAIGKLALQ